MDDLKAPTDNALATGPFGSAISSRYFCDSGVPVIRGSNLSENVEIRLVERDLVYLSEEKAREFSRSMVHHGDLIFTCWGTVGQVGLIDNRATYDRYIISNKQMKLTPDPNQADSLFLYYLFSSPGVSSRIKNSAIGSSVPGFNLGQLRSLHLRLPSLVEQQAITYLLGALDDKIDLNRRTNETLEAMARALFKSWFVDFDPVRAKREGRAPVGMDAATAALFPDGFEASELGEIPRGWRVVTIADVARRVAMGPFGSSITRDNFVSDGIPVIRGNNLADGFNDDGFVFLTEHKANELKNANAFAGDIVFTHRGTLGQVGRIPETCAHIRYVVSQSQMLLTADEQHLTSRYLYYFFRTPTGQASLLANTSTTGVPAIARPTTSLKAIKLLLPRREFVDGFEELAGSWDRQREANIRQSRTLTALRDALLPKLLSGEIRIKDAEKFVERSL